MTAQRATTHKALCHEGKAFGGHKWYFHHFSQHVTENFKQEKRMQEVSGGGDCSRTDPCRGERYEDGSVHVPTSNSTWEAVNSGRNSP